MMAVKEGRTDIVSLLLQAGADTDIQKKVLQFREMVLSSEVEMY